MNLTRRQEVGEEVAPYVKNEIYTRFRKDADGLGGLELTGDRYERACCVHNRFAWGACGSHVYAP